MDDALPPPQRVRLAYYLFEARVPPSWLAWVERDIASPAWLAREIVRLIVMYALLGTIFGPLKFSLRATAVLAVGICAIIVGRDMLRRIAVAYQRYGWDWSSSGRIGAPYMRLLLATVFAVVVVLLTR